MGNWVDDIKISAFHMDESCNFFMENYFSFFLISYSITYVLLHDMFIFDFFFNNLQAFSKCISIHNNNRNYKC